MPELPEVETTVRDLKKAQPPILGTGFFDLWTDWKKVVKKPKNFEEFKKGLLGKKILDIKRRGKNILFFLSQNKVLLIHQKLTGHLLYGKWEIKKGKPESKIKGPISEDPMNRFLHLIFFLNNGWQLAISDLRKFAKVELWDKEELENSKEFKSLGPEPLEKDFTFEKFKEALSKKKRGKIKQVLMDQNIIAGIGNIYSDEILWQAKIHPFKDVSKLKDDQLKEIYKAMKEILKKAILAKGESISDYRRISGEKGGFDPLRKVYRREGEKCFRCGSIIKRIKLAGRSAHFCPACQKK
jgi:formamidopyrimidine-DNA glycosylase